MTKSSTFSSSSPSKAWLFAFWGVVLVTMVTMTASASGNVRTTRLCVRWCNLWKRFYGIPCPRSECEQEFGTGHVLDIFRGQDLPLVEDYRPEVPPRFDNMQKRVKEEWEGPAPADINH